MNGDQLCSGSWCRDCSECGTAYPRWALRLLSSGRLVCGACLFEVRT